MSLRCLRHCRSGAPAVLALLFSISVSAKVVVFWQDGFPSVATQPITRRALETALQGRDAEFAGIGALNDPSTLKGAGLLVMPYGSALPEEAWPEIRAYLDAGGNLLVLGGQPFRVPVTSVDGKYTAGLAQDTYSRWLGILHTYEAPQHDFRSFVWKDGYSFLGPAEVRAQRVFVLEGPVDGLGYMLDSAGEQVAAPVVVADDGPSRRVMLDFEPEPGYWESDSGIALIRDAAAYAHQGATRFWVETGSSFIRPGEHPHIVVHIERAGTAETGEAMVQLMSGSGALLQTSRVRCGVPPVDQPVDFERTLPPGFYTLRGTWQSANGAREAYENGFWVGDEKELENGPVLGVHGDFLTRDGRPFFPFGTNYFTTEKDGWDFSEPRNALVWDRDFEDMAKHNVTFVRTGVWMGNFRFVDRSSGVADERFLRNLTAFLLSAHRHGMAVNFTFFAFDPQTTLRGSGDQSLLTGPGTNPYLDPVAIGAEQKYVLSIVRRFSRVPWLCWDLINEPSFSNPKRLWHGNTPDSDSAELAAWRAWLHGRYGSVAKLASAWSIRSDQFAAFDAVPLPSTTDLEHSRSGDAREVRAIDYNLFAQEMFAHWVAGMVHAIRDTGSTQLIDVGQDEGGVTDRVLNKFYAGAGVSFTTNHSYWNDDALLWDSVVSRRPGVPNIIGETGYQPVWQPDGEWRYDERTGYPLLERKWALGFAAGASGALQWDWAREPDFGMKRSDGSAKIWEDSISAMGAFAGRASAWATGIVEPQIAIVLPQSLQLSVLNHEAIEAQQNCVRALYQYAREEAYAVGEYQIDSLAHPKLIILPSPWVLSDAAWQTILMKVRTGATLLVSGPFDDDPHFHETGREHEAGLDYRSEPLTVRDQMLKWAGGAARLSWPGDETTFAEEAVTPDGSTWVEKRFGEGHIFFATMPLELNDNLEAIGSIYRYAAKAAGVRPTYSTSTEDPGILICPTRFPHATLYVLSSESSAGQVSFDDAASGARFSGALDPGHAALLLVGDKGEILASCNWRGQALAAERR